MNKAWLVARHEFGINVRRPGFLFGAFGVPLLIIGLLAVIMTFAVELEGDVGRVGAVGYVDHTSLLESGLEQGDMFIRYDSEQAARAALDDEQIGAYFVLADDYMTTGVVRLYSLVDTPQALNDRIRGFLVANISADLDDPALLARLQRPVELSVRTLDSGRTLGESAVFALIFVPFVFVFVVIMAVQITGGYLMSGVVEEKSNRIMEILITSITPFQLLLGKVLGLGLLGLIQVLAWVVIGIAALSLGQNLDALQGIALPTDMIVLGVILFLLTYTLYACFAAGVGVVVGSEQESRQIAGFYSFVMAVPFFFLVNFLSDPNGPVPVALTLIPLTAPMSILLRMGFGTVPAWQLILSMGLLILTTVLVVWASARLFRWGMLHTGNRPGLRQVWRILRRSTHLSAATR